MIESLNKSNYNYSKEDNTIFIEYCEYNKECNNTGNLINNKSICKSYYLLNELMNDKEKDLLIGCDKNITEYFNNEGILEHLQEYYEYVKHDDYLNTVYNFTKCGKVVNYDKFGIYIRFNLNINEGKLLYNICKHNKVNAIVLTSNYPISLNAIMLKPISIVLSLGVINDVNLII